MADRIALFRRLLDLVAASAASERTYLDLGSGHGKFALAARRAGWNVIAVDGRTERFPDTDDIEWVRADVREYEFPEVDCIGVLGLLYHLEFADQMKLLTQCVGTPTIIDTHVASKVTTNVDGYDGYRFWEDRSAPTASLDNEYSFWPTRASFHQMLSDVGFETSLELVPWYQDDRTFWLCV
jgi:predicted RNA methylase